MKRYTTRLFIIATMLLYVGPGAVGQELDKLRRPVNNSPKSLFDIFGIQSNVVPDAAWQGRAVTDSIAMPAIISNTDVSGGPAGTERLYVLRDAAHAHCVTAGAYPAWVTVFNKSFTTGPGTKFITVVYTTQANVDDNTPLTAPRDGLAFSCMVSQDGEATYTSFSNATEYPFLVSHDRDGRGHVQFTTYSGFIAVDPNLVTNVRIQVTTAYPGTVAQACFNNLIINY